MVKKRLVPHSKAQVVLTLGKWYAISVVQGHNVVMLYPELR